MGKPPTKGEWSCVIVDCGALCVMTCGALEMHKCCVGNWGTTAHVRTAHISVYAVYCFETLIQYILVVNVI